MRSGELVESSDSDGAWLGVLGGGSGLDVVGHVCRLFLKGELSAPRGRAIFPTWSLVDSFHFACCVVFQGWMDTTELRPNLPTPG